MSGPVIDHKNPFYCPKIPASVYLRSLRRKVQQLSQLPRQQSPSLSFSRSLERSAHADYDSRTVQTDLGSKWILGDYFSSGRGWLSSQGSDCPQRELLPPPYSPVDSTQVHHPRVTYRQGHRRSPLFADPPAVPSILVTTSLKRKNLFSDLTAPPKYARSIQSFHDSSFDLELKREVLHFSDAVSSSPHCAVSPSGAAVSTPLPSHALIEEVALALPGIRLKERLKELQSISAQDVMNFLAENGAHILMCGHAFRYLSSHRVYQRAHLVHFQQDRCRVYYLRSLTFRREWAQYLSSEHIFKLIHFSVFLYLV
jgi:hypothetical protein